MKLWLVKARDDAAFGRENPFAGRRTTRTVCVRARTEDEARALASSAAGAEGRFVWLDDTFTTCERLTVNGDAEIILCECGDE